MFVGLMLPKLLVDAALRFLIDNPYHTPEAGIVLHDRQEGLALVSAPACASDSFKFQGWLAQGGVYVLTHPLESRARLGKGQPILNRVNTHRITPPLALGHLWAIARHDHPFDPVEQGYLETAMADEWRARGNGLVSNHFDRRFPSLTEEQKRDLDGICQAAFDLIELSIRVLDRDIDEFRERGWPDEYPVPLPPSLWTGSPFNDDEVPPAPGTPDGKAAVGTEFIPVPGLVTFPVGARLYLQTRKVRAFAVVEPTGIYLMPGSLIQIDHADRPGREHARDMHELIEVGDVQPLRPGLGIVKRKIRGTTPANLAKFLTAGRIRNGGAWKVVGGI